jgi:membrane associated rhomboid family serine protease
MVFSAVGIKCPECAGTPAGAKRAATRVRSAAGQGTGFIATNALIVANILVYVVQSTGGTLWDPRQGEVYQEGFLSADRLAAGEWWRLVTSEFLHGSPIHLFFNMLLLWWFGRALEALLGRGRFLAIYFLSILAGSAGAVVVSPETASVGASGAVFGILGAGLVLERNRIDVFGGSALFVVLFNLAFTFTAGIAGGYISIGSHVGGLVGGVLAVLAFSRWGRGHAVYGRVDALALAGLAGIALASVALAYLRVRGYA